jgi:hypothetical protein
MEQESYPRRKRFDVQRLERSIGFDGMSVHGLLEKLESQRSGLKKETSEIRILRGQARLCGLRISMLEADVHECSRHVLHADCERQIQFLLHQIDLERERKFDLLSMLTEKRKAHLRPVRKAGQAIAMLRLFSREPQSSDLET